ncbi:MAG: hypothetical protein FJX77_06935 [Armatimonadetes bacterium]|nr:hypothetical protein [Armatimonadota bacterium]
MAIVLDLPTHEEARLRDRAARLGVTAEQLASQRVSEPDEQPMFLAEHSPQVAAILAFAVRLRAGEPEALRIHAERCDAGRALLQQWRSEPGDPDEIEGYPETISPLRLRQPLAAAEPSPNDE